MILGILFPKVPTGREWDELSGEVKVQHVVLGALQIIGIALAMLSLLFA